MPKRGSPEQHTGKVCSFDCVSLALRSFADAWDKAAPKTDGPLCLCPATSEYDPPCPKHGVVGIGVVGG